MTKVSWAHPEFGSIVASSSFDRTVKIWEQATVVRHTEPQQNGANGSSSSQSNSRWVERAVLTDSRGTLRSVEFAPHHFGLKIVSRRSPKPDCILFKLSLGDNLLRQPTPHLRMPRTAISHDVAARRRARHPGHPRRHIPCPSLPCTHSRSCYSHPDTQ